MSKERRRINVRGFQIFEAVARHRSLTRAAEELGITQSAVSHQLRTLTERLGEDLVERQGRAIRLTDAGKRVARSLDAAFDLIEEQVTVFESDRKIVRVGAYSSFAASWLIPRLPDFRAACPDIELRLIMLYDPHEISALLADIFITSQPLETGYSARRLFSERLVPVMRADGPEDFSKPLRLISAEADVGVAGRAWKAFAILNGLEIPRIQHGEWLCCSHYILAQEMVLCGLGLHSCPTSWRSASSRKAEPEGCLVRLCRQASRMRSTFRPHGAARRPSSASRPGSGRPSRQIEA